MNELSLQENNGVSKTQSPLGKNKTTVAGTVPAIHFNWKDSPSVQRLLDVISSILAEEYIATAKQNPEVFLQQHPALIGIARVCPSGQGAKT